MSTYASGGFLPDAASTTILVWLLAWGIRRQGELDIGLDRAAKRVRWLAVGLGVALASAAPKLDSVWCALGGWVLATAFLAWPNFAHHLTSLLRWARIIPNRAAPAP